MITCRSYEKASEFVVYFMMFLSETKTTYNKILPGDQPRQVVKSRYLSAFNHLMRLVTGENFIILSRHESFKSYKTT
jgi:hypothetical protein